MLYKILRAIVVVFLKVIYGLKTEGQENIPVEGKAIICSNHIHALDPLVIAASTKRKISFLAKKDLFSSKLVALFFKFMNVIPVHRDGNDAYTFKVSMRVLKNDGIIGLFAEGTREGKDRNLLPFKQGISMLAIKTRSVIVPAYISGEYKCRGKLHVKFGKPFCLEEYYNKTNAQMDFSAIVNNEVAPRVAELKNS